MGHSVQKPCWWEYLFAATALLLSTGAFIPLFKKQGGAEIDPMQGDTVMQALWLGVYAVTCILLLLRSRQVLQLVWQHRLLWCLIGLAFISIAWSEAPQITLRRSIALWGTTLFGIYLATRYTQRELLKLLAGTFGFIAILSSAFALLLPWYGLQNGTDDYIWRGIYENKNYLGAMMCLAVIVWLINYTSSIRTRLVAACFACISALLLILSNSVTALLVLLLVLVILFMCIVYSYYNICSPLFIVVILVIGVLVSWMAYSHWYDLLTILGRNNTLSGRTVLWQLVWDKIQQRPWLGYGYSAFWLGWDSQAAGVWNMLHWTPPHAHNGYLDLWLELGLVGISFFVLSLLANFRKAFVLALKGRDMVDIFPVLFFAFTALYNITESTIMARNSIFWVLYVVLTVQLSTNYSINNVDTASDQVFRE